MQKMFIYLLFAWRNWFGKHLSIIWNMVSACLMWLVCQECNNHIFEDNERPLDLLKSLLFGTLFWWACIWSFMQCISISNFPQSASFSSWAFCICFMFRVFITVNMMFISFNKSLITYQKKKMKKRCIMTF